MNTRYPSSTLRTMPFGGATLQWNMWMVACLWVFLIVQQKTSLTKPFGRDIAECYLDELKEKYETDG